MRFNLVIKLAVVCIVALILAAMAAIIGLPHMITPIVKNKITSLLDLEQAEFTIEKIGMSTTVIRHVTTGDSIDIDTITLTYSLRDLVKHNRIGKVSVSGMEVNAVMDDQAGFHIKDLDTVLESLKKSSGSSGSSGSFAKSLPEKINITHSVLKVTDKKNETITIPFSAQTTVALKDDTIEADGVLNLFFHPVAVSGVYNRLTGISRIKLDIKQFDFSRLSGILTWMGLPAGVSGKSDISLAVRNFQQAQLNVSLIDFDLWPVTGLRDINTRWTLADGKVQSGGEFTVLTSITGQGGTGFLFEMDMAFPDSMTLDITGRPVETLTISAPEGTTVMTDPALALSINGSPEKGSASFTFSSPSVSAIFDENKVQAVDTGLKAYADYDLKSPGKILESIVHFETGNVEFSMPDITANMENTRVSGKLALDRSWAPDGSFEAWVHNAGGRLTDIPLFVSGMEIHFPFVFPFENSRTADQGRFSIGQCSYDDTYRLSVKGFLAQKGPGCRAWGNVKIMEIESFAAAFDMTGRMADPGKISLSLEAGFDPFTFSSQNMKAFLPGILDPVSFSAVASAGMKLDWDGRRIKSDMSVKISDADLEWPDKNISMTDLRTELFLEDIMAVSSRPEQLLEIKSMAVNDIRISDMSVTYTIESLSSILVENTRFKWCNGHVTTEAFRFPRADESYSLTLYCDRLELAQLLYQVGSFEARGDGTVNGRIPLLYSDGRFHFDNGFLFSTPGSSGTISLKNTQRLISGIPEDTVQYAQLDLAREALKQYEYKWARLNLNSEEDTLLMNLQFDGQPANPVLPFEFKKDIGAFVRVDASSAGSKFQGIKLDVNVRIPFHQMIKFGTQIGDAVK